MEPIRIEFRMPFKGQTVAPEWEWGIMGVFNPDIDYQKIAKRILRHMPLEGPSSVRIKAGDRLVGVWCRFSELCEQYGM
jgi:hypothetical protein